MRILIASPYPAMRAGLRALLEGASPGEVTIVAETGSAEDCLALARATQPEIALFDLALEADEEMSGLWRLRAESPGLPILALSESNADARVIAALQGGARGCLPKTATGAELLEAARKVIAGQAILHPSATATLLDQLRGDAPAESLTPREVQVLGHVAGGLTNKAIALRLGISEHTVKFHLGSAMSKLGAASRAEAVAVAMRRGVIAV
ncbi:MAG: response regulator transcription factor [Chloroflexi bacterium]|nr:response regulator transcription factor [Chloroflexota bacterium]